MTPTHIALLLAALFLLVVAGVYFKLTAKAAVLVDEVKPKPNLLDVTNWIVGPVYNNQPNPSKLMPIHPSPMPVGFALDFATPKHEVHYVTINFGSLKGKLGMRIKGEVITPNGAAFVAASDRTSPATLCLYFQRQYDDWNETDSDPYNDSDTESYRWWATSKAVPLVNGKFDVTANFSDVWTACEYSINQGPAPAGKPIAFLNALKQAGEVGFTLGGGTGWGHGGAATAPSRLEISEFSIF